MIKMKKTIVKPTPKKIFKKIKPIKKYEKKEFTQLIKKIKTSKNQPKWYKKMFEGWLS